MPFVKKECKPKGFYLQANYVFLTYKTHLPKREFYEWLNNKNEVDSIAIAHETGKDGDYPHTHIAVRFARKINKQNPSCFDYGLIHPNIKQLKGKKAFEDAIMYIKKEDKDPLMIGGERSGSIVKKIWEYETDDEALECVVESKGDLALVPGVVETFSRKPRIIRKIGLIHDWQRELKEELVNTEPDPRKVIWIVDEEGNTGKTQLAKHLQVESKDWYVVASGASNRDMATILQNALNNGWTGRGIFIDLSRQAEDRIGIYGFIESLKNGLITTSKYRGKFISINPPHVVVFSNWWPKVKYFSMDRWDIREIRELTLYSISAEEVLRRNKYTRE